MYVILLHGIQNTATKVKAEYLNISQPQKAQPMNKGSKLWPRMYDKCTRLEMRSRNILLVTQVFIDLVTRSDIHYLTNVTDRLFSTYN